MPILELINTSIFFYFFHKFWFKVISTAKISVIQKKKKKIPIVHHSNPLHSSSYEFDLSSISSYFIFSHMYMCTHEENTICSYFSIFYINGIFFSHSATGILKNYLCQCIDLLYIIYYCTLFYSVNVLHFFTHFHKTAMICCYKQFCSEQFCICLFMMKWELFFS